MGINLKNTLLAASIGIATVSSVAADDQLLETNSDELGNALSTELSAPLGSVIGSLSSQFDMTIPPILSTIDKFNCVYPSDPNVPTSGLRAIFEVAKAVQKLDPDDLKALYEVKYGTSLQWEPEEGFFSLNKFSLATKYEQMWDELYKLDAQSDGGHSSSDIMFQKTQYMHARVAMDVIKKHRDFSDFCAQPMS